MLGNSVMAEFMAVCQHCRKQMIDYVSWDVGKETWEVHLKQESSRCLYYQNMCASGAGSDLNAQELCNEI